MARPSKPGFSSTLPAGYFPSLNQPVSEWFLTPAVCSAPPEDRCRRFRRIAYSSAAGAVRATRAFSVFHFSAATSSRTVLTTSTFAGLKCRVVQTCQSGKPTRGDRHGHQIVAFFFQAGAFLKFKPIVASLTNACRCRCHGQR